MTRQSFTFTFVDADGISRYSWAKSMEEAQRRRDYFLSCEGVTQVSEIEDCSEILSRD